MEKVGREMIMIVNELFGGRLQSNIQIAKSGRSLSLAITTPPSSNNNFHHSRQPIVRAGTQFLLSCLDFRFSIAFFRLSHISLTPHIE